MVGERRCVSCRKLAPKSAFWRVVRTASGAVLLDRGMGRSAYICPNADCLYQAKHKKRLAKALKAEIPPQIFNELADRLLLRLDDNRTIDYIRLTARTSETDNQAKIRGSGTLD
jgi:predicted RNA-binding protein YlxR (DUF448 family)